MKGVFIFFGFVLFLVSFSTEANRSAVQSETNGVYIVYMGTSKDEHAQLLNYVKTRKKIDVIHTYNNGFSGFSARLSEEEAKRIAKRPGVVSVFPDPVLQLHTTRSWDFLKYQTSVQNHFASSLNPESSSTKKDTIIGFIDTGIWPESASFNDKGIGAIPSNWKGKCMTGVNFTLSNCNRKLIGARYYVDPNSYSYPATPRDYVGHGTHVASTAAGMPVSGVSYHGHAKGTAQGGSPSSRIAMYAVCDYDGCQGSYVLKAFDDAIADGVDVLSVSLGPARGFNDFVTDPFSIGSFHAVEKGIVVVASAGNEGPDHMSVVNVAPWIFTIGASTIDRDFETDIVLRGNWVIKGGGINFSNLPKTPTYPLIDGWSALDGDLNRRTDFDSRNCVPGNLREDLIKGKIVLCDNEDNQWAPKDKFEKMKELGAIGMILNNDDDRQVATKYGSYPIAAVSREDGAKLLSYIRTNRNPLATILPSVTVQNYKLAPVVAYFSSRGPTDGMRNLLKPDIIAPGVAVLAAWPSEVDEDDLEYLNRPKPPLFNLLSGTSMSCPHVSGIVAIVKSHFPTWSPSAIKSAIMTTAIHTNNVNGLMTTNYSRAIATPYDMGSGEINPTGALQPGLIYETEDSEYLHFLCNFGYDPKKIKIIASSISTSFSCPSNSSDLISNMNYPSIVISSLWQYQSKTVRRRVTYVGEGESTFTAVIEAPDGVSVRVSPNKMRFTKYSKMEFQVTFTRFTSSREDLFGSITWQSAEFKVRSPFVVSVIESTRLCCS